ncbi:MAG: GAF domain-containing protein [Anaerolineae bacterium]|jgi:GAF domain-containing protein
MFERIKQFLNAPVFEDDEEKNRVAGILNAILLIVFAAGGLLLTSNLIWPGTPEEFLVNLGTAATVFVATLSLRALLHRGDVQLAGWILSSVVFVLITLAAFAFSGQSRYDITGYFLVVAIASAVVSGRAAILFSFLGILASGVLMFAQASGALPGDATAIDALTFSIVLAMTSLLLRNSAQSITEGFTRIRHQQHALVESNYQLQKLHATLQDHAHDLEHRSAYLEASSEVTRAVASVLETEALLQQVVELIRLHFNLYYAGLFQVDETGQWAVLRAGTGQAGQAMLARGHRIKVGEGMIGWCVAYARARVALDVSDDVMRLVTAELPDTRSEAALPLRSRGRVIGALTVQSDEPGTFTEVAMAALQTMADHVAVALDNARLYTESQAALEITRRAYGDLSQQAWAELLGARTDWGYRYAHRNVTPVHSAWRSEMRQAAQTRQTVLSHTGIPAEQNPQLAPGEDGTTQPALAIPIMVREQVVGVLGFRKSEGGGMWTDEEIALLETLAGQLGPALESAQLHQETQDRAIRERLTGQIAARIRETLDIETVLQTAAREMREALGLEEAEIRIGMEGVNDTTTQDI